MARQGLAHFASEQLCSHWLSYHKTFYRLGTLTVFVIYNNVITYLLTVLRRRCRIWFEVCKQFGYLLELRVTSIGELGQVDFS